MRKEFYDLRKKLAFYQQLMNFVLGKMETLIEKNFKENNYFFVEPERIKKKVKISESALKKKAKTAQQELICQEGVVQHDRKDFKIWDIIDAIN